ncbi:MAG: adenylate/guanylate cyclase domain-containing protein [Rhodospirillales bacterium]
MPEDNSPPRLGGGAISQWLSDGATLETTLKDVFQGLCGRLAGSDLGLHRVALFVIALHPNLVGSSYYWLRVVRTFRAPNSIAETDEFNLNPTMTVMQTGAEVRRRLCDQNCPDDYPILAEFRGDGITDYVAMPMRFVNGEVQIISYATDRPRGFTKSHMKFLRQILPLITRLTEVHVLRSTAVDLLDAYLGKQSGARVLDGQVKRGDGQDIHAVIWFSDLRDSTPLAERLGRQEFLAVLNDYLECMAGAVLDHGGEVLRFIGDAALAIFPIGGSGGWDAAEACAVAVDAAGDAMDRMAALNAVRAGAGESRLGYGIGLHLGHVMYGNFGTPSRIEFTVIGAAANEAARIEGQCKALGVNFLASESVVRNLDGPWRCLGAQRLKGISRAIDVFTLSEA